MDFNTFDSRTAGDLGAWMHVNSPINGEPLYVDESKTKPCRVKVLGIEGVAGQAILKEAREAVTGERDLSEDTDAKMVHETAALIVEFENINDGAKPATAPASVEWFLNLQRVVGGDHPTFLQQVREFSLKRANLMGNVSGGSLKPRRKSVG